MIRREVGEAFGHAAGYRSGFPWDTASRACRAGQCPPEHNHPPLLPEPDSVRDPAELPRGWTVQSPVWAPVPEYCVICAERVEGPHECAVLATVRQLL